MARCRVAVTGCRRERSRLRLPALGLDLAIARGAALADALLAALDRHRVVRDIPGDDRARADIGAGADLDRRHQRRVGADEGALADQRLVLAKAVVIAGDGAGADVGV